MSIKPQKSLSILKPQLTKLLNEISNLNVIVIGEAMLDSYLLKDNKRCYLPGGGANTAANVHSLGGEVSFLSVIGEDSEGFQLQETLKIRGISTEYMFTHPGRQTLVKKREIVQSHLLPRWDYGSTNEIESIIEEKLINKLEIIYPECDAVIISDYGYGILTKKVLASLSQLQQRYNKTLVVNSKSIQAYHNVNVTAVKLNYQQALELLEVFSLSNSEKLYTGSRVEYITLYGEKLLHLIGAKVVAVTLDAEGAIIFEDGSQPYRTYTQSAKPSCTIGAGDTFTSALTLALSAGATTTLAANFAASAAAVVVKKDATSVCSAEELRQYFCSASANKHITDSNQLVSLIASYRKKGLKIVFTNGCFDILHAGHVYFLNSAKALGDILIVGVNSDDSIRRIKGSTRPINTLEDRIHVLSGLECVDHLIAFNEDIPLKLIRLVKPHVHVKGGDYTKESLPEAPLVEDLGGVVEILPLLENHSTSIIIKRICRNNHTNPL